MRYNSLYCLGLFVHVVTSASKLTYGRVASRKLFGLTLINNGSSAFYSVKNELIPARGFRI
jgi:hypothetical protein